jgi:hypothetical protein
MMIHVPIFRWCDCWFVALINEASCLLVRFQQQIRVRFRFTFNSFVFPQKFENGGAIYYGVVFIYRIHTPKSV